MADADTLVEWDRKHLWHPFTQMADWGRTDPVVIERGEGSWLVDTRGRRWLDGVSSIWTNVHGHNHPHINEAIRRQLEQVAHTSFLGVSHPAAIELARSSTPVATAVQPGLGFDAGAAVTVQATDYASDLVSGELVGLSHETVSLRRSDERAGTVHVHFPRIGYTLRAAEAKVARSPRRPS